MQTHRRINMVFVHGRPGSGKGAQVAEIKRAHPELSVIYFGTIFYQSQNPGTEAHRRFSQYIDPYRQAIAEGNLGIPPEDFFQVMTPTILETIQAGNRQILFDGFPRGLAYLEKLDSLVGGLTDEGNDVRMLHFFLKTQEAVAVSRIHGRGEREQYSRPYDNDTAIRRRMDGFESDTLPMLEELRARGQLVEINGDRSVAEIAQEINPVVNQFLGA